MSDTFSMDKHFELAGVTVDDKSDLTGTVEAGNDTTDGASTESGTGSETQSAAPAPDKIESTPGKDSLSGKLDGKSEPGKEEKGKSTTNPGDITLRDGSVVKAGAERRWFESAQNARQELAINKQEMQTMRTAQQNLQTKLDAVSTATQQIGMEDPMQVSQAVRLYKDLARDPVATVTKLLAEIKGLGHTVEGIGGAVDNALLAEINRKLNPSEKQQTPEQQRAEVDRQAGIDVQQFIGRFPDALTHEAMIASVVDAELAAGRQISLQDAYFRLKEAAAHNGFDWSKPLEPQIAARKTPAPAPAPQPAPLQGRPGAGVQNTENLNPVRTPNSDESSDSIILAAMKDNGYNYQR